MAVLDIREKSGAVPDIRRQVVLLSIGNIIIDFYEFIKIQ